MGWALAPHGPRKIREYVFVFRVYFLCLQHVFFFWLGGRGRGGRRGVFPSYLGEKNGFS